MKRVFTKPQLIENNAKQAFGFPEFIMMENAGIALENEVLEAVGKMNSTCSKEGPTVFIICGSGNNGADGIALARRLYKKLKLCVYLSGPMKTSEGKTQFEIAKNIGIEFSDFDETKNLLVKNRRNIIVDCLFGTGFHGKLDENFRILIEAMNNAPGYKISCDIPSALEFKADVTVTMGTLKSVLFGDKAKDVCGKIKTAGLGIADSVFESAECVGEKNFIERENLFLIEKSDIILPYRTKKSSHKGNFGHTTIIAGEKAGAAIIAAESALSFGSGLVTIVESDFCNLNLFKICPQLMISKNIPEKTNAIVIGSGLGRLKENHDEENNSIKKTINIVLDWAKDFCLKQKIAGAKPARGGIVLDADIFYYEELDGLLFELNRLCAENPGFTVILTPHLKEMEILLKNINENFSNLESIESRLDASKAFLEEFPFITLVCKSANTLIATRNKNASEFFIVADGSPSLAKAGSGDVLAGLCASLLSQNYEAKEAAITGCESHALCSQNFDFELTSEKLIENLGKLQ